MIDELEIAYRNCSDLTQPKNNYFPLLAKIIRARKIQTLEQNRFALIIRARLIISNKT